MVGSKSVIVEVRYRLGLIVSMEGYKLYRLRLFFMVNLLESMIQLRGFFLWREQEINRIYELKVIDLEVWERIYRKEVSIYFLS